jgi:hypothetical protein
VLQLSDKNSTDAPVQDFFITEDNSVFVLTKQNTVLVYEPSVSKNWFQFQPALPQRTDLVKIFSLKQNGETYLILVAENYLIFVYNLENLSHYIFADFEDTSISGFLTFDQGFTLISQKNLPEMLKMPNLDFTDQRMEVTLDETSKSLFIMSSKLSLIIWLKINQGFTGANEFFEGVIIFKIPRNVLNFCVYRKICVGGSESDFLFMISDLESTLSIY